MSDHSDLQCWEIIQCNKKDNCILVGNEQKACWENVRDDKECSFHICVDCLVYLTQRENSIFNEAMYNSILKQRKEKGIRNFGCNLSHDAILNETFLNR